VIMELGLDLDMLVEFHKAMADKTRLRILALLKIEDLCVCEFVEILQMTQPAVSQHLRKLKNAKLVKERREGQWVFYSLDGSMFPFFQAVLEALPDMKHEIEELKKKGLKVCR
jgi:ArsR family transcriptional regulator